MKPSSAASCLVVCLALSCSSSSSNPDGGTPVSDGGPGADGGARDGGPDSGVSDGGVDSGVVDAGATGGDGGLDAGTRDAGSGGGPDSGVGDAGRDGGCPYAYCEDFDEYDAGPIMSDATLGPWQVFFYSSDPKGAETMTIDPGGFGGSKALRVDTTYVVDDAGQGFAWLTQTADAGTLVGSSTLYGRAEIQFASDDNDAGLAPGVHSYFFSTTGPAEDGTSTNLNLGGAPELILSYVYPKLPDGGSQWPGEDGVAGGPTIATGVWHCVQWQYEGLPENATNIWLDGVPVITVNDPAPVKNWVVSDSFNTFSIGYTHLQEISNSIDFYIDDFALDSQMVPCP